MSVMWRIRLARQAEADMSDIMQWTIRHFGHAQAEHYAQTVIAAIEALGGGPDIVGARMRSDIAPNVRTLHVARQGRKGRHFVVFRVADAHTIEVLRVLHDNMDLARHIPAAPSADPI